MISTEWLDSNQSANVEELQEKKSEVSRVSAAPSGGGLVSMRARALLDRVGMRTTRTRLTI